MQNKMKKSLIICAGLLGLASLKISAQDIHFSQLNEAPLMLNPANAGFHSGYIRAIGNYRSQWSTAKSPFTTMSTTLDADVGLKNNKAAYLGIGGFVFQDKAGDANWKTFKADLYLNGIVKVGKESKLALGIGSGFAQNSADLTKLTFGTQYNGQTFDQSINSLETVSVQSYNWVDMSAGINYEYDKTNVEFAHNFLFYLKLGAACYHIQQPKMLYSRSSGDLLARKWVGSVNSRIDFKDSKFSLLPSAIYVLQGKYQEINFGTLARYRFNSETKITGKIHETALLFGAYYRFNDALIPQLMIEYKGFNLGMSYDYNISNYKKATRGVGGFEISLRWTQLRDGLWRRKSEVGGNKGRHSATP